MFQRFWHKCPRCQARMKAENLKERKRTTELLYPPYGKHLERKKGKKLIGWDEIIDGGLAPDATVMSWRGMEAESNQQKPVIM